MSSYRWKDPTIKPVPVRVVPAGYSSSDDDEDDFNDHHFSEDEIVPQNGTDPPATNSAASGDASVPKASLMRHIQQSEIHRPSRSNIDFDLSVPPPPSAQSSESVPPPPSAQSSEQNAGSSVHPLAQETGPVRVPAPKLDSGSPRTAPAVSPHNKQPSPQRIRPHPAKRILPSDLSDLASFAERGNVDGLRDLIENKAPLSSSICGRTVNLSLGDFHPRAWGGKNCTYSSLANIPYTATKVELKRGDFPRQDYQNYLDHQLSLRTKEEAQAEYPSDESSSYSTSGEQDQIAGLLEKTREESKGELKPESRVQRLSQIPKQEAISESEMTQELARVPEFQETTQLMSSTPMSWARWPRQKRITFAPKSKEIVYDPNSSRPSKIPVDSLTHRGWTPLLHACEALQLGVVKYLISVGADVNYDRSELFTPLMASCSQSRGLESADGPSVVAYLLDQGAAVNKGDRKKITPLMYASMWGNVPVVLMLLERGAFLEDRDAQGYTALSYAAEKGNGEVMFHLFQKGANAMNTTIYGATPAHLAQEAGYQKVADILDRLSRGSSTEGSEEFLKLGPDGGRRNQHVAQTTAMIRAQKSFQDVQTILSAIEGGTDLVDKFREHFITREIFLTLTDADLKEIGVSALGTRRKILEVICKMHKRAWDPSSLELERRDVTSIGASDLAAMLSNIEKHVGYISSTLKHIVRYANPTDLQVGCQFNPLSENNPKLLRLMENAADVLDSAEEIFQLNKKWCALVDFQTPDPLEPLVVQKEPEELEEGSEAPWYLRRVAYILGATLFGVLAVTTKKGIKRVLCDRPPPFNNRPPPLNNRPPPLNNRPPPLNNRPPPLNNRPPPLNNRPPPVALRSNLSLLD
ncbi:unnamed protein product, partial [Cyprideis torosa]